MNVKDQLAVGHIDVALGLPSVLNNILHIWDYMLGLIFVENMCALKKNINMH